MKIKESLNKSCLCDTCKNYVPATSEDTLPGCIVGIKDKHDDFYCPGCDENDECQGCGKYEN